MRKHFTLAPLAKAGREVRELPDGFMLRFDGDRRTLRRVLDLVELERGCCGSLRFEVVVEPNGGPVWLTLRGDTAHKEFLSRLVSDLGLVPVQP